MTELRAPRESSSDVAAAILAGGGGRRLSPRKPLLDVGGVAVIERVLASVRTLGIEPFLITNTPDDYDHLGLRATPDVRPGLGPLGGILTALRVTGAERVLVVAADLPFLRPQLLRRLVERAGEGDCIVAEWDHRIQPLHGVYGASCDAPIQRMVDADELCPLDLYPLISTVLVSEAEIAALDPEGLSFFNINTPEDLEEARRMATALAREAEVAGSCD
ncbi:MAG TPA: molybdenum cofactor guanylyltransferase [Armatimonadota bacterium]|nr:molybdenum cofactor guanylyltransferase [Armatimonadota bacterium]